jgi:hypothetical protein
VPIVDLFNRAAFIPSVETVEEVKIQVSTYDAELGRTAGGVFNTTLRSGANVTRGTALYAQRPEWGTGTQFFTRATGQLKPETSHHLWAASTGGPIVRDRTFWWASTEGYRSRISRSMSLVLPTARERTGDFSQSPGVVIYDPATTRLDPNRPGQYVRDAFPGNIIPANRINPVARTLLSLLPTPTSGRSLPSTARPQDLTTQATLKIDHRLSDSRRLSAMYAWYHSDEPAFDFYNGTVPGSAFSLPRTVHVAGVNFVSTPGDWTTLAVRYGVMQFADDQRMQPSDGGSLGFASTYAARLTGFPTVAVDGPVLFDGGRDVQSTHGSHAVNASLTHLVGRHALRAGADYRRIGLRLSGSSAGDQNGSFAFTPGFTRGPDANGSQGGDSLANLLLGFPSSGSFSISTPNRFLLNYVGGYLQDDVRLGSTVTLNVGLRYEYEQGLHEQNNALTVGFDRDRAFPVQVPGVSLKGGLMYAGVDGYPTQQGNAGALNFGPRTGVAWTIGSHTVIRAGYGLFVAPPQIPQTLSSGGLGTRGFSATTTYVASEDGNLTPCSTCTLTNPFPRGVDDPAGSANGLLTGAGGDIDFVDQSGGPSRTHRFSADIQHELPGRIALAGGYIGSRSRDLPVGGSVAASININQLDPRFLSLGSALQQPVTNPFFGNAAFGALSTSPTVPQGQLLRPYPQFMQVRAHRVTAAHSRYDALALAAERRFHDGWGARVNYVFSVHRDNQAGEGNSFSINPQAAVDYFDLEREYGYSLRDTPHRLNISGTWELPFGTGRRWLSGGGALAAIGGGWSVSGVGFYQSGFPVSLIHVANAPPFGFGQRPNRVPGVDPIMPGDPTANYDQACTCIQWLNPAAWAAAAPFTLGDAPHADENARTPSRRNVDLAFEKRVAVARARLTLRADVLNVFDDTAFNSPRIGFGTPTFGQIRADGGVPRTLQLMVRVGW